MDMISSYYKVESVLIAIDITIYVCFEITLFLFQTKYDFTSCFGIVCIFTYSRFLAVDTQLITGGKRHEINVEDHVFASFMLYINVIYIFVYILSLFGYRK
ncbi:unnamed protein product [Rotaria sordida]|uniref:Uncharacterized protein n=1 Tax=Rotaria sordida TaxID=392033 RepID=A0A820DEJ0_9BILA|nr:unnamed protein product [Rotaria sordida]CAF4230909.1 unnamed protein product [Rotaria sordida]